MHLSDRVILIRYDAFIEDNPEGTLNKVNIAIPMIGDVFSSLIKEERVTNDSDAGQNIFLNVFLKYFLRQLGRRKGD